VSEKRILIIEDSGVVARPLQRALELHFGDQFFEVERCASAEEALQLLDERPFDLLISDLMLPGINGLELLEQVAANKPAMPSIIMTAFGSPQMEIQVRRVATAFLPKPFTLNELVETVERALGRTQQEINSSGGSS
jgi:DNA-binding NtrC family response regulator